MSALEQRFGKIRAEVPKGKFKQAAVMVLFRNSPDGPEVLMLRRAKTLTKHSGDWAFPGGSVESDDASLMDTAMRETEEEIGVFKRSVKLWGELTPQITGSGYIVFPFTGEVEKEVSLRLEPSEVEEVCAFPLSEICNSESKRGITFIEEGKLRDTTAYAYKGRIVWGASARILSEVASVANIN